MFGMTQDKPYMIRHLDAEQLARFQNALRSCGRENIRHLGEAWAQGQAPAHTPKWVAVPQADGTAQTYVLSAKVSRGKYGRFRRAMRADGTLVGIKDFRLAGRFLRDMQRRAGRIETLVQEGIISAGSGRQLGFNELKLVALVRAGLLSLMDVATIAKNRDVVMRWVAEGRLTAEDGTELVFDRAYFAHLRTTRPIPPDVADKIAHTHYSAIKAIDTEYNLLRLGGSPLAEMGRFAISNRLFVLTQAMDIDAFTLAKLAMSDAQRMAVTRHVLARLARGLARFHRAGIVHRDVKLENALLDASGATEPADVGLATQLDANGLATQAVGTLQYAAPEMVAYQVEMGLASCPQGQPYTQAVDVFSLGIAAASMAVRRNMICGDGADALAALKDFARLREACPRHPQTGVNELSDLLCRRFVLPVQSAAVEHLCQVLGEWHAQDPPTASYVFAHMLAVDPRLRASMHDVDTWFGKATQQADADARITAELVQAHVENGVADERAMMQAFSTALGASYR